MKTSMIAKASVLLACLGTLIACNGGENQTNIELIQGMMDQISIKAQDWDPEHPEKVLMLTPPEGTLPRGYQPIPESLATDPEKAGRELANPLKDDFNPETISRGKEAYRIYCGICHGDKGMGDGTVAPKMVLKPPSLVSDKVTNFPDGRIYFIITQGQGVMGSYASQITDPKDRWAIVNYMKTLQKRK